MGAATKESGERFSNSGSLATKVARRTTRWDPSGRTQKQKVYERTRHLIENKGYDILYPANLLKT